MKHYLIGLLAALAWSGVVRADDQGPGSKKWEVQPLVRNAEEGCYFSVTGKAQGLPNGTALHVSLTTPGSGPNLLKAAFYKVLVQDGNFSGSFHWPKQQFAPLVYTATVELYVSNQPPSVRTVLMREFGYPQNAREVVAEEQVALGTDEERTKFSIQSLKEIRAYTVECQGLFKQVTTILTGENPMDTWRSEFREPFMDFQNRLRAYQIEYVVRREGDLVMELRNLGVDLGNVIRTMMRGGQLTTDLDSTLASFRGRVDTVLAEINSRLPLGSLDDDESQSEDQQGEKTPPEQQPEDESGQEEKD